MINPLTLIPANENLSPYEFDKLLIKEYGKKIFFCDSAGRISGLNQEKYKRYSASLKKKIRNKGGKL